MTSNTISLVFTRSDSLFSYAINAATFSKWSHVGVLIDDYVIDSTFLHGGVRKWDATEWLKKYPEFEVRVFEVPNKDNAVKWAHEQIGKPYDWKALIAFLQPNRCWHDPEAWFCSEFAESVLKAGGLTRFILDARYITPRDSYIVR
jgi:uncharacterized protein YycO